MNQTAQTASISLSSIQSFNCLSTFFKQIKPNIEASSPTTASLLTPAATANIENCVKLGDERHSSSASSLLRLAKTKINNAINSTIETNNSTNININNSNINLFTFESSCLSRELINECGSLNTTTPPPSSAFIDPTDLKRMFDSSLSKLSKFFVILLDCRTYNEFNLKHIKDSVHLNCRDKLTKKRLQTRKLTVKDLISCEEVKSKFDSNDLTKLACQVKKEENVIADTNNIIVIYDDKTSDLNDLQSEANPLKIVQDNIKQCGFKNNCKILKGGFKKFSELCPEFCVNKEAQINNNFKCIRDIQPSFECDLRQSDIENALMTQILSFLYLGNELDAKNINKLEQDEVYYILNVTKNIPFYETTNKKFKLKRIAVNDNETQNLKDYFEEAAFETFSHLLNVIYANQI